MKKRGSTFKHLTHRRGKGSFRGYKEEEGRIFQLLYIVISFDNPQTMMQLPIQVPGFCASELRIESWTIIDSGVEAQYLNFDQMTFFGVSWQTFRFVSILCWIKCE